MTTALSDVGLELFEQLTDRTFYVVDTEFSTHEGEHHLISIGIVPVVGGRRTKVRDELYKVMNPGPPIDDESSAFHLFTTGNVAKKRHFDHNARFILRRLREDDAVFVSHGTIDAHVLRRELERLDERAASGEKMPAGLADLPVMPILNTQLLAHASGYPGIDRSTMVSLQDLCDLTEVGRPATAHNAQEDARATADALIELLRYCAENAIFWTLDALLQAADGGTTHAPKGPGLIKARPARAAALPPEHIAKHLEPLTHAVAKGSPEAERWLDMAAECAKLRCPFLRDEAKAAAPSNGALLLRPLMEDLPHMTEPGQAGTLLGAVNELLTADAATLPARAALKWWRVARPHVLASTPCDRSLATASCPSCLDGHPCPRDVLHLPVAHAAMLGTGGILNDDRVHKLLAATAKSPINTWRKHHRDVLAYALWAVAQYLLDEGQDEDASDVLERGIAMTLHEVEPRLTELTCDYRVENGDAGQAFIDAATVLSHRTTDTAYADLADWVQFTQNALYAQQPTPRAPITEPRRARPEGHANPRLYS